MIGQPIAYVQPQRLTVTATSSAMPLYLRSRLPERSPALQIHSPAPNLDKWPYASLDSARKIISDPNLLAASVSDAYLTGRQTTEEDGRLLTAIQEVINTKIQSLSDHYASWAKQYAPQLIGQCCRGGGYRSFYEQAAIDANNIGNTSTIENARISLMNLLFSRSVAGFSRHHWGTDVDTADPDSASFAPGGALFPMIPFFVNEAPKFGFYNSYPGAGQSYNDPHWPYPDGLHYHGEPWHMSYYPISQVLAAEWDKRFRGEKLASLLRDAAIAIRPSEAENIRQALSSIDMRAFQTNVAAPPGNVAAPIGLLHRSLVRTSGTKKLGYYETGLSVLLALAGPRHLR